MVQALVDRLEPRLSERAGVRLFRHVNRLEADLDARDGQNAARIRALTGNK
jgi:hypothetical protein